MAAFFFGFVVFPFLKLKFGGVPDETANLSYYLIFASNFNLIENGLPDASVLGVLWSVAIEEQFYLVWPIVLSIIPIKRHWIIFILIIVISWIFRGANDSYKMHEFHTLSCIGDMAIGALGAWLTLGSRFFSFIVHLNKLSIIFIYALFTLIFIFRNEFFFRNFNVKNYGTINNSHFDVGDYSRTNFLREFTF